MGTQEYKCQLPTEGECAVIHVAPSWIYSVKVLRVHYDEMDPSNTLYELDAAWVERANNSVDLATQAKANEVAGLQARAGIQMKIRDRWISFVWRAHTHVDKDVNPTT